MNHTLQAKIELATRMLRGQIDVGEVALMADLPIEQVQEMRDEMDKKERAAYGGLTVREMGGNAMIIDNELLDDND